MTNHPLPTIDPKMLSLLMQPYVRLAQRNTQLFTSFSASPEMVSLWLTSSQKMFNQAMQGTAGAKNSEEPRKMAEQFQKNLSQMGQSDAFSGLVQGLMQSHMQFLMDLAQNSMALLGQTPARMMEQMQQVASNTLPMPLPVEQQGPRRSSKSKTH